MKILITGTGGFIGFHVARSLLDDGNQVLGYDNLNDYYDPRHKYKRLEILKKYNDFAFIKGDLEDQDNLEKVWKNFGPTRVLHLAAQAGVRYSIENPRIYINSNIIGFQNVIELVRKYNPENFVYASSSSVYGGIKQTPFKEEMDVRKPVSFYAATKASNELVAYTYNHLFKVPATGLRFFTVYGPYARPDMAMYKFSSLMIKKKPIPVFNHGNMVRDFTYIDDIVNGIKGALNKPENGAVYNLGRGSPMKLMDMISYIEENLGITAEKEFLPLQPGDVPETISDISKAKLALDYNPKVDLKEGVKKFSDWFKKHLID